MKYWLILTFGGAVASTSAAGPPVTSAHAPSPGPEVARVWIAAAMQAPFVDFVRDPSPHLDAARMLVAVQRGDKLGPGVGWYGPSHFHHTWPWIAGRFDIDRDGRITRTELAVSPELFRHLDRDRDGAVTADDLDWTERSAWVRQDAQALRVFRMIDTDGDGRATEAEMKAYHKKLAGEKGFLTTDDLRGALSIDRPGPGKKASQKVWLRCLMDGDLGSPFDGPAVGQDAPDFTLASQDGMRQITLSEFRTKRPVVLIFGSFT